jgi:hypothetical protein
VLPRVDIVRWRAVAPWADDDDVEQDLVITLALLDIFRDETLKSALAFRGGTALHKLHLPPAARYSEDIDLVQREPSPIGPTLSRLRRAREATERRSGAITAARAAPALAAGRQTSPSAYGAPSVASRDRAAASLGVA